MDQAVKRALQRVADRVGDLGRVADEFARVRQILAGDRIVGIARRDQARHGRRQRDRVARRDGRRLVAAFGRDQPGGDEIFGGLQGAWGRRALIAAV